ncbi:MAG TPA: twin-arginine translocase TatA/TatE family subunit [Opitutae bacterium]|nr:twin-arginine translocase TatA/TatE family subunit [Opitutae bacterium]
MKTLAFIQNINLTEIVILACIILLFFGAKRLPDLIRSVGKSCREFKKASGAAESSVESTK